MEWRRIAHPTTIQQLRHDYLRGLVAPMDGMWERAAIARAAFWDIRDGDRSAGYACIDSDNILLRFHLAEDYRVRSQEIFRWAVASLGIRRAIASTIEPPYLSLCLDLQQGLAIHSYLFRDGTYTAPSPNLGDSVISRAADDDFEAITAFYYAHTPGSGEWIEPFVREHLDRGELFGLYKGRTLVAMGECIPSQTQPPYADLGMVVATSHRGQGLGSIMLCYLKARCYDAGQKPICSCAADNAASKSAIAKAGFIGEHRMLEIVLQD